MEIQTRRNLNFFHSKLLRHIPANRIFCGNKEDAKIYFGDKPYSLLAYYISNEGDVTNIFVEELN